MSRPEQSPLIALVHRANRELQADMVAHARRAGFPGAKPSHNAVFGTLPVEGARSADLAARAGVTRQSMGEVIRELVDLGVLEMGPDPADRRAKWVTYTEAGLRQALDGRDHIAQFEERMVKALGGEGYEQLRHGLDVIVAVLEDDGPDVSR
jgi:DNA-binding MarR family transcriptional regulator